MAVTDETCKAAGTDLYHNPLLCQKAVIGPEIPINRNKENSTKSPGRSSRRLAGPSPGRPAAAEFSLGPTRIPSASRQSSTDQRSAKKIRAYRNGDRFFAGMDVIILPERLRGLEALLHQLSRQLADTIFLANGVRFLFSLDGNSVESLDQLMDGQSYVCSSGSVFKKLDYANITPRPQMTSTAQENALKRRSLAEPTSRSEQGNSNKSSLTSNIVSPKRVSVFLNGPKPRQLMRLLLDDRSAQSFTHILDQITRFFSPLPGPVRKVYNITLKLECFNLADFFHGEIFVAATSGKISRCDLDLDPEEEKLTIQRKISRSGNNVLGRGSGTYVISSRENTSSPRLSRRMTLPKGLGLDGSAFNVNHPPDIRDRYHIGKSIGNGNFASVHECIEWRTGRQVAMKVIEINKIRDKKLTGNEISILRRLKHPNIVNLLDEYSFAGRLYVVMELVKGGDLFSLISEVTHFSESQTADMIRCLCHALDYLHSNRVVHRDVKPENLLVMENTGGQRSLKLADFGLATLVKESEVLMTICGSPTYVAPEILTETGYGSKVDIWAAGVTAFILLCGYPPFQSENNHQETLFELILSGEFEFRSPYWDHVSASGKDLICRMMDVNVDNRYHANQILDHEWMRTHCRLQPIREASVVESLSSDSGIQLPTAKAIHIAKNLARSTNQLCGYQISQAERKVTFEDGAELLEPSTIPVSSIPRFSRKFSSSSVRDLPAELSRAFWDEI